MNSNRRHRPQSAAEFLTETLGLPTKASWLNTMVTRGGGPPFTRWGKYRLYEEGALIAWAEARLGMPRTSSSDATPCHRTKLNIQAE